MARAPASELVPIDPDVLLAALDGRTRHWLATRAGISDPHMRHLLRGGKNTRRTVYERMRAALPALPPPPEPTTNGRGAGHE